MQPLKRIPTVISESEKMVCLQKDMAVLKQQIASMTAKNSSVIKESAAFSVILDEIKSRIFLLETKCATKAESQHLSSVNDVVSSLKDSVNASIESIQRTIKELLSSLNSLQVQSSINLQNISVNNSQLYILKDSLSIIRKEIVNTVNSTVEAISMEISEKLSAIPQPIIPLSADQISKMINEAIVPFRNETQETMERSRETKMKLALLEKKLEKR